MQGEFTPIAQLQSLLRDDIERLNAVILNCASSRVPLVKEIAEHIINAGGKRLRPLLTIASARIVKPDGEISKAISLAAAVELLHTATLIHDDVIDESDLRRNLPTANSIWDNKASVLVGDFLFSKAFHHMVDGGSLEILGILSDATTRICEGEVKQLSHENDLSTTIEDYKQVVELKTSALFAAACLVGAKAVDASHEFCEQIRNFGFHLGLVFQKADDVLDYQSRFDEMGKNVGDDYFEGKMTLPLLLAMKKDRAMVEKLFASKNAKNLSKLQHFMQENHIYQAAYESAEKDAETAKTALKHLSNANHPQLVEQFFKLVDWVVRRKF